MNIKISGIIEESIVDGPGLRYVVFTQGCCHNCKGCHNTKTHDINGGRIMECEEIVKEFKLNPLIDGLTLSGGEPFLQPVQCAFLAEEAHKAGLNVITYSGYTFEELYLLGSKNNYIMLLLENTDILVDGRFILEEKDILLKFRGSANQRIIDVKETLKNYKDTKDIVFYSFKD